MPSSSKQYKYNGQTFTAAEIALYTKVHPTTIYARLKDHHKDPKNFPLSYVFTGEGCKGVPWSTLRSRIFVLRKKGEPEALAYDHSIWRSKKSASNLSIANIASIRTGQNLTQKKLAELCGVSQFTISNMERDPSYGGEVSRRKVANTIKKLCKPATNTSNEVSVARVNNVGTDSETISKKDIRALLESLLKSL